MKSQFSLAAVGALLCVSGADAAPTVPVPQGAGGYSIIARLPIGGNETGYDFLRVDGAAARLYVTHGTRVEVLQLPAGQKRGEVAGLNGVHGVELLAERGKGYASDGLDRTVVVFDRNTLVERARIGPTGLKPDDIRYDPVSARLFVVNGGASGDVTVIDPATDAIVGTVELGGGKLEQIGFDGHGRGFVNDEAKAVVHVFDTASLRRQGEWTMGACKEPTGLAVDTVHHRVYAACGNNVLVALDSGNGHVVATVPIGTDPDGVAFDARQALLFVSNRDGTLDVIHEDTPDRYQRVQVLATGPGARTLALDDASGRIYVPTAQFTAAAGGGRPTIVPGTFTILVIGRR